MHNMVCIIGRLCDNVEIIKDGDKDMAIVKMAIQRDYKNEDGVYEVDFIDVVLYNMLAEHTAEYCRKGDLVGVKGRIQNIMVDSNLKTYVVADRISFLSSAKSEHEEKEDE